MRFFPKEFATFNCSQAAAVFLLECRSSFQTILMKCVCYGNGFLGIVNEDNFLCISTKLLGTCIFIRRKLQKNRCKIGIISIYLNSQMSSTLNRVHSLHWSNGFIRNEFCKAQFENVHYFLIKCLIKSVEDLNDFI